jgi:class 3 adenylate cyclase
LNASNSVLQKLRNGLDASEPEVKQVAGDGLKAIAWRAVLDYFGWNSTRDMIARDRAYTHEIIEQYLETTKQAVSLRDQVTKSNAELAEARRLAASQQREPESQPNSRIELICGFIDMVDSTRTLISNPNVGPEGAAEAIRAIVGELEKQLQLMSAQPVSFTGDGLLFFWERSTPEKPLTNVRATLRNLEAAVEMASQGNPQLRGLLRKMNIETPKLRVALAHGEAYYGKVGPTVNLVGMPVVEAARVAALKEDYEKAKVSLLISQAAYDHGASWGMWQAADFQLCTTFTPKGTGLPIKVYQPVR